jgi:hypothetical protein
LVGINQEAAVKAIVGKDFIDPGRVDALRLSTLLSDKAPFHQNPPSAHNSRAGRKKKTVAAFTTTVFHIHPPAAIPPAYR